MQKVSSVTNAQKRANPVTERKDKDSNDFSTCGPNPKYPKKSLGGGGGELGGCACKKDS